MNPPCKSWLAELRYCSEFGETSHLVGQNRGGREPDG